MAKSLAFGKRGTRVVSVVLRVVLPGCAILYFVLCALFFDCLAPLEPEPRPHVSVQRTKIKEQSSKATVVVSALRFSRLFD